MYLHSCLCQALEFLRLFIFTYCILVPFSCDLSCILLHINDVGFPPLWAASVVCCGCSWLMSWTLYSRPLENSSSHDVTAEPTSRSSPATTLGGARSGSPQLAKWGFRFHVYVPELKMMAIQKWCGSFVAQNKRNESYRVRVYKWKPPRGQLFQLR